MKCGRIFLVLLCTIFSSVMVHALRLDRVIISSDTHPNYMPFWPIVARAWKEIIGVNPTLIFIAEDNVAIDETCGEVIRFKPIPGIKTSLQAQVIRLLAPAFFPDDVCITSDVDMIPLSRDYFVNSIRGCAENQFVVYRDNAYGYRATRFPMCYIAAKGSIFAEVFKIDVSLGFYDAISRIIVAWDRLNYGWETDERLLYQYLTGWKHYATRCARLGHGVSRRIDREKWEFDLDLFKKGHYIDAHVLRPYSVYHAQTDELISRISQFLVRRS